MAEDILPLPQSIALGPATTPTQASTHTYLNSYQQQSVLNHVQTPWINQKIQEMNEVAIPQGELNNQHSQKESIMDLKVQVAVLQNELLHKERERQEAVRTCGIVAKAMSIGCAEGFPSAGTMGFGGNGVLYPAEKGRLLEQEVKILRRENALLWQRIDTRNVDLWVDSDDEIHDPKIGRRLASRKRAKRKMSDNGETSEDENHISPYYLPHDKKNQIEATLKASTKFQQNKTTINSQEPGITPDTTTAETKAWGQSLNSGTTTAPNSPIIPENDAVHTQMSSQDVGLESLDDIIGPDGSEIPLVHRPQVPGNVTRGSKLLEEGLGLNEDMKTHMESMIPLQDLPAPRVLKTGFDVKGSFQGSNYLHTSSRGRMGFNRFFRPGKTSFSDSPSSSLSSDGLMVTDGGRYDPSFAGERHLTAVTYDRHSRGSSYGEAPGLFRYGIRYVPSETDSNYMRRIVISNLPKGIELRDVLSRVRGGEVVSSTLLDTEKLTGGMTAMIEFSHQVSAEEYFSYAKAHPICFGSSNKKAEITLLKTPTWPLITKQYPLILKERQTRCLAIPLFPKRFSIHDLERWIQRNCVSHTAAILDIYADEQETLHLEFSSMVAAHFAYNSLSKCQMYSVLKPIFTHDPCAGEVEELASPLPYRTDIVRRDRELTKASHASSDSSYVCNKSDIEQRNKPAALSGQMVIIPSFSGSNIMSSSWADEVIEEAENGAAISSIREHTYSDAHLKSPILSPLQGENKDEGMDMMIHTILMEKLNQQMASNESRPRKHPLGLSRSKYASIIPRFLDSSTAAKSKERIFSISPEKEVHSPAVYENMLLQHDVTRDDGREQVTSSKVNDTPGEEYSKYLPTPSNYSSLISPVGEPTATDRTPTNSTPRDSRLSPR